MKYHKLVMLFILLFSNACSVGPNYKRPEVVVPSHFKEAPPGWKIASPIDDCDRGKWWQVFNDPELNRLEEKVEISNQNIKAALAQYDQARALVAQAQSAFYPIVGASGSATRQKNSTAGRITSVSANNGSSGSSTGSTTGSSTSTSSASKPFNDFNIQLDATWAPDLWGSVRRSVESAVAGAQASKAQLALTSLLAHASLAQYYFELRGLDGDQVVLDNTVKNYQNLVNITQNQYAAGTASEAAVLQAKSLLALAQVQAIDNGINRAVYEHAIAVLIGEPASLFTLASNPTRIIVPQIPSEVPSTLLERRPDIAQSERLMAQANAQIGVAIAAFFPVLTLSGTDGFNSTMLSNLFSSPANFWSIGAQLADTIFDGGLRSAKVAAAKAFFEQNVAMYRQTVLAAFQDVEDNLATLRILTTELDKQMQAVQLAKQSLQVVLNEYQAGTLAFADVLNAEITLFTAEKGANDIQYRQLVASVGLIRSLGGGWDVADLVNSAK